MHKSPYRPSADVSQQFNSGVVTIYQVTNSASPGRLPVLALSHKVTLRYEERRLGIQRYYSGRQNQKKIERVIRVPASSFNPATDDVAQTEDGKKYRIDLVQTADVFPPALDLTLVIYEQGTEATNGNNMV